MIDAYQKSVRTGSDVPTFESQQKYTGTRYTTTAAFLMAAFVFSPAILLASSPFGYLSLILASLCSMSSLVLAWISWTRYSSLTIPSILIPYSRLK